MSWQAEILSDIPTLEAQQEFPPLQADLCQIHYYLRKLQTDSRREERSMPDSKHVLRSSTQPLLEHFSKVL